MIAPLKVERPRERTDAFGVTWRVVAGALECRADATDAWTPAKAADPDITAARVEIWHGLYTTPTECCEVRS